MRKIKRGMLLVLVMLGTACDNDSRVDIQNPITPTPTPTAPTAPAPVVVEFRVIGDLPLATVRVSNGIDGLTQTTTGLPYSQTVVITTQPLVFLSLDARATGSGFLHVGIFVNGVIFREASAATFSPFVAVSGTFRR